MEKKKTKCHFKFKKPNEYQFHLVAKNGFCELASNGKSTIRYQRLIGKPKWKHHEYKIPQKNEKIIKGWIL